MGQAQSQIDPTHIGIYRKLLAIQSHQTRLNMIDTLFQDPNFVVSAKRAGIYGSILQYSATVRHGGSPGPLPGEVQQAPPQQPQQQVNSARAVLPPPQIQQNRGMPPPQHYHPQAFQTKPVPTNQIIPTIQSNRDPYREVSKPKRSEKALNFFSACLRVLDIHEEVALSAEMLKASYKKAVVRAHPDKPGGSKEAFDAVTRAYAYLMDILNLVKGQQSKPAEAVPELDSVREKRSQVAQEWSMPQEPVRLNPKNLNMTVFNQLFEQTRVPDPDEDGYGDWLKNESNQKISGKKKNSKKFSEDFNREVFNRMFEEEAGTTTLSQYHHPQELVLNQSYGVELGRDRPSDYTAAYDSKMQFTDLKSAYTKENVVSDKVSNVKVENRDFNSYKAQREKAPEVYNPQELAALQAIQEQQKMREEQRRLRAAQEQITARDYFERMKQLVITEK
jgi:curved DNA-binding protein CbpA